VAINLGEDSVALDGVGLGLMLGFRGKENTDTQVNLGAGYMWGVRNQVLQEGYKPNAAPPDGSENVGFKQTSTKGFFVVLSGKF